MSVLTHGGFCVAASSFIPNHLKDPPVYNITASDKHQFIWFRVAKVGTRSILEILHNRTELSISGYNIPFKAHESNDYFKFAFVRNPWDRVVSCYHKQVLPKFNPHYQKCFDKDFDFFVDFIDSQDLSACDIHIKLQTTLIPIQEVDFIGRFERFAEDLRYVLDRIGMTDAQIVHKNRSEHKHYSAYYTKRTKRIIAKKYKKDIQAFSYTFERNS